MWNKFKHWLIRKLGGYVAPCYDYAKCTKTIIQTQKPIEKIEEWLDMNQYKYMGYDYTNSQPIAKKQMLNEKYLDILQWVIISSMNMEMMEFCTEH